MESTKAKFLAIDFACKRYSPFRSPVMISKQLIEKMRVKRKELGKLSYIEYDPNLFNDDNIVHTFKYVLENIKPSRIFGTDFFYSQLPPSQTYVYVDPQDSKNIPADFKLEKKNKNGKILFSTRAFWFELDHLYNELIGCGINTVSSIESFEHISYPLEYINLIETKDQKYDGGRNVVSNVKELELNEF